MCPFVLENYFQTSRNANVSTPLLKHKNQVISSKAFSSRTTTIEKNVVMAKRSNPTTKFICPWDLLAKPLIELSNCVLVETLSNEENEMQDKKKKSYDVSQKCQEFWTLKFPWVEMIQGKDGGVYHVHYLCCSNVCKRDLFLAP